MGCAHSDVGTVSYVDRDKFMGDWHVIAGRFTSFEDKAHNAVERYHWNEEKQRIDIDFSFNYGSLNGPLKKIPQKAWIINEQTNATWKVSPFWPLKFTYLVIALDPNYEWTVIGVPNKKYLWLMSKTPSFSREKSEQILKQIESTGYPINDIVWVPHSKKE
jgi:apolipoprotein D and lipocalin family protein